MKERNETGYDLVPETAEHLEQRRCPLDAFEPAWLLRKGLPGPCQKLGSPGAPLLVTDRIEAHQGAHEPAVGLVGPLPVAMAS